MKCTLFTLLLIAAGFAQASDREAQLAKFEAREAKEPIQRDSVPFPAAAPTWAVRQVFDHDEDQRFEAAVWWDAGETWVQITPLDPEVFVCSSSFLYQQDGVVWDTARLEDLNGFSWCGDLFGAAVFRLTHWSFYDYAPDLLSGFTLLYASSFEGFYSAMDVGGYGACDLDGNWIFNSADGQAKISSLKASYSAWLQACR